jgi:hypothetical protein
VIRRRQNSHRRSSATHRRGAILAAALIEFVVVAAILFSILQGVIRQHRQILTGRQQLQAQWLAQAGVDRAVAQLHKSADYHGENWRVPADQLDGASPADVKISIEPVPDHPDDRHLTVEANTSPDSIHSVRRTREATIHLK